MTLNQNESMRAHLLVYDIPQGSGLPNPSAKLWALGARINLSCWIIPDRNVVRVPVADWRAKGATVELVRFDERDGETIIRLAREALERQLKEVRERTEVNMTKALAAIALLPTGDVAAVKKRKSAAQVITWRARKDIEHATECALLFDLTADVEHLFEAARLTIVSQERLAFEAVKAKLTSGQVAEVA